MDLQAEFQNLDAKKAILIGVLLGVVYYFLLFDEGVWIDNRIQSNQNEIQQHAATLSKVEKALEDERRFNQEIQQITSHMNAFLEYFPLKSDKNQLMKIISSKAESNETTLVNLKPVEQKAEFPNYPEQAFSISVEGSFHQVMGFVSELTQLKRVVDFRDMKFRVVKRDDVPRIELQTVFIVYSNKDSGGSNG